MDDLAYWGVVIALAVMTVLLVGMPLVRLWSDVSGRVIVALGGA